ncbi:hypothetical protein [Desulfohalovibrio reitneri]|uniref:COG1470 family protein n=1 Tax=Desulfohalovibrio reitneri TaxID=1307759 RepID=UPI0009DF2A51|nr:hypothetical protein [Desulfohalovibrio reitneri]
MVRPMEVAFQAKPGQRVNFALELKNTGGTNPAPKTFEIMAYDLAQTPSGGWTGVAPSLDGGRNAAVSCREWINLPRASFTVEPMRMRQARVEMTIPANAKGSYFASLYVKERAPEGVNIAMAFQVPIMVEIQGRTVRQRVEIDDVDMRFREAEPQSPATTLVRLDVANNGRTFSTVEGRMRLRAQVQDKWLTVADVDYKEKRILPGVKLNLLSDLERRLPSGTYKLEGTLYVDGRRVKPLEKTISFTGDPTVEKIALDSALYLEPPELFVESTPGAMRTAVLRLRNASPDTITVETYSTIPKDLAGVSMGELMGHDLSCADWIRIYPEKFRIRGGATQNVRVVTNLPRTGADHSTYYGDLVFESAYPDGQSAGTTRTLVCLGNSAKDAQLDAAISETSLAAGGESGYVVTSRCVNIGGKHFTPRVRADLVTGIGEVVQSVDMEGESGLMLPLATRRFSGTLDFAEVEEGTYELRTTLVYGEDENTAMTTPVHVTREGGAVTVSVLERAAADEGDGDRAG